MNSPVDHTIEQFASACHDILKKENNPAGRSKVCALLQEYLKDQQFVSTYITDKTPERQVLYEDPELGFCILAHQYHGAKMSAPHDHGPYWAIYGQAARRNRDERLRARRSRRSRQDGQGAHDPDLQAHPGRGPRLQRG